MVQFFDNTKVSTHIKCERKFFFRHELHWASEESPYKADWGSCWHSAMDVLWPEMCGKVSNGRDLRLALTRRATDGFMEKWGELGYSVAPEVYEALSPHTPTTATEMLWEYIEARAPILETHELLAVEVPFAVPLWPDRDDIWYCGRLDKVTKHRGKVIVWDHKSTGQYKKNGYFRASFTENFSPDRQIDGYSYAARILYPDANPDELWIDAALVHKTVHEGFGIIPVKRHIDQLDSWLWATRQEVQRILDNEAIMDLTTKDQPFMPAFRQNTANCFDFGSPCQYLDQCKMWSNPIGRVVPPGMKVEEWSPFDVLQLDRLGMVK
ncbi:hypothetical protein LCGC14_2247570 [marine sediment metagenome]|uniref:PD-(D/E)XK endonuclease-like domain-containing protein n=1 Tax=marine sediment metagenome TaxID=412755 RepID=A0A0F9DR03_9ZZZZ